MGRLGCWGRLGRLGRFGRLGYWGRWDWLGHWGRWVYHPWPDKIRIADFHHAVMHVDVHHGSVLVGCHAEMLFLCVLLPLCLTHLTTLTKI